MFKSSPNFSSLDALQFNLRPNPKSDVTQFPSILLPAERREWEWGLLGLSFIIIIHHSHSFSTMIINDVNDSMVLTGE